MLKKTANLFTTAYLLLMFCVYPFYVEKGYENIGEAKNRFFLYISISAFVILGICALLYLFKELWDIHLQKKAYLIDWNRVSATDLFVLLYATFVFLSYVFSEYRDEALWGTEGWYIGLLPLLLLCGLYFLISRMWNGDTRIFYLLVAASALVFLLGICNRFSLYPIKFAVTQPDFISTLGNINWFCGYLSVTAPVGIGMFLVQDKEEEALKRKTYRVKRWILGSFTIITFTAGFCQGSNSIFLWFGSLFFVFLWISVANIKWLTNWFFVLFLWGGAAQLVRLLRILLPDRYNYDTQNLCGYFTETDLSFWIAAIALLGYSILKLWKKKEKEIHEWLALKKKYIRVMLIGVLSTVVCLWVMMSAVNTWIGSLGFFDSDFFLWNDNWGNGRGAAIKVGVLMFQKMPFLHKLIGVGPDCFCSYAYSIDETAAIILENFGGSRLTNAHNEILTSLINVGILGTIFYMGIFLSSIRRSYRKGIQNPMLFVPAVCVICYLCHNMVSFAQVLNLPFVIIMMAMGEKMLRGMSSPTDG